MLDIDHFKQVNDTYGHKVGDMVLKKLSTLLVETLRNIDISGRIGGEEFAIMLPETDKTQAFDVAERLRKLIETSPITLENGLPIKISVSIGIATLKGDETNIDTLLNIADEALYKAKKSGRNKVVMA
jgi:diguanylate cyclase (GGDEF)-like protein